TTNRCTSGFRPSETARRGVKTTFSTRPGSFSASCRKTFLLRRGRARECPAFFFSGNRDLAITSFGQDLNESLNELARQSNPGGVFGLPSNDATRLNSRGGCWR